MAIMHRISQQVVLDHVAHLPGLGQATSALQYPPFRDGDFDVIDGAAVPVIDEQELAKRSASRLRDRLFTEIVVDTVDLTLFKNSPTGSLISRRFPARCRAVFP